MFVANAGGLQPKGCSIGQIAQRDSMPQEKQTIHFASRTKLYVLGFYIVCWAAGRRLAQYLLKLCRVTCNPPAVTSGYSGRLDRRVKIQFVGIEGGCFFRFDMGKFLAIYNITLD